MRSKISNSSVTVVKDITFAVYLSYRLYNSCNLPHLVGKILKIKNLTHYQMTNFRLFQTEEFADNNSKFYENGGKCPKWLENTVGKGEIACDDQFLLFLQCFQKTWTADT